MLALIAGLVSTALIASAAFVLLARNEHENTTIYLTMLLSFLGVIVNQLVSLKVSHDTQKKVDNVETMVRTTPPDGIPKHKVEE